MGTLFVCSKCFEMVEISIGSIDSPDQKKKRGKMKSGDNGGMWLPEV